MLLLSTSGRTFDPNTRNHKCINVCVHVSERILRIQQYDGQTFWPCWLLSGAVIVRQKVQLLPFLAFVVFISCIWYEKGTHEKRNRINEEKEVGREAGRERERERRSLNCYLCKQNTHFITM